MKKFISTILALINILMILTLCSCETTNTNPNQYTLVYMSSDGGKVTGEQIQIVNEGDDAETVIAVPNDGYEFAGWSDGVETAERTDTNVTKDIDIIAYFKLKN